MKIAKVFLSIVLAAFLVGCSNLRSVSFSLPVNGSVGFHSHGHWQHNRVQDGDILHYGYRCFFSNGACVYDAHYYKECGGRHFRDRRTYRPPMDYPHYPQFPLHRAE